MELWTAESGEMYIWVRVPEDTLHSEGTEDELDISYLYVQIVYEEDDELYILNSSINNNEIMDVDSFENIDDLIKYIPQYIKSEEEYLNNSFLPYEELTNEKFRELSKKAFDL